MSLRNLVLKVSYENQFVVCIGYSFIYNSVGNVMMCIFIKNFYFICVNIEEVGNLLYVVFKLVYFNLKDGEDYVLVNIFFV